MISRMRAVYQHSEKDSANQENTDIEMSKRPMNNITLWLRVSNNPSCSQASSRKAESRPDDDHKIQPRMQHMCEVSFDTSTDYTHAFYVADEVKNSRKSGKQRSEKQDTNNNTATNSPVSSPKTKTTHQIGEIEKM